MTNQSKIVSIVQKVCYTTLYIFVYLKYKASCIQESASVKYVTVYIGTFSINEVYAREYINIIPPCIFKFHIFLCAYLCASQFPNMHLITNEHLDITKRKQHSSGGGHCGDQKRSMI